ncbi:MAG: valine--tRNA ligase, partial [Clostridia bacterium]|nr:valine--tRNA ligase [Clostridia bacterium]
EEVFGYLPGHEGMLITSKWPEAKPEYDFPAEADRMEGVMEVIRAIRNLRAEMNVAPGRKATLMLRPHEGWSDALLAADGYFKRLAGASAVELLAADAPNPAKSASAVCDPCELFIPLGELVDVDKEIARMNKDLTNAENEIARADAKLHNEGFLAKAPAQLVEQEKAKLEEKKTLAESIRGRIRELEALR